MLSNTSRLVGTLAKIRRFSHAQSKMNLSKAVKNSCTSFWQGATLKFMLKLPWSLYCEIPNGVRMGRSLLTGWSRGCDLVPATDIGHSFAPCLFFWAGPMTQSETEVLARVDTMALLSR